MSKFVSDIIDDISKNPREWFATKKGMNEIAKDNVNIWGYGNTRFFSIIHIYIDGYDMPITSLDKYRLEVTAGKWFKNCPLDHLIQD